MQPHAQPTVFVREKELGELAEIAREDFTPAAALLREELRRAIVLSDEEFPRGFARLGSAVEYVDFLSDQIQRITLATHDAFGPDARKVSVASPLGAALIGLCPGDVFSWTGGDGKPRTILVVSVTAPDRAPGDRRAV
ncbi:GreA/GreB family elongation factor [Phenylobacterium sp. LjRoot219]|uniref:GreA/GreB family elongation factor n=1 Tax=Phenylobacterium sp. LjRoot219 TaxID=3342283 RepID=UPI003ECFD92D